MDNWDTTDPQDERTGPEGFGPAAEEGSEPSEEGAGVPVEDASAPVDGAAEVETVAQEPPGESPEEPPQWTSSRLPWEVADSVAGGAANGREPAPWAAPAAVDEPAPEPPPARRRSFAVPVLVAFVLVVVIAAGGAAYYFHAQAAQRKAALEAAVQAVSLTASPEFADTIEQRLAPIRRAIDEGKYDVATNRLSHIMRDVAPAEAGGKPGAGGPGSGVFGGPPTAPGGPAAPGAGGGEPTPPGPPGAQGPPAEAADLPPAAMAFFEANPDLAQTVGQANMAGLKLSEMGGDVGKLRKIREAIIEAARLHDKDKVIALLGDFQKELQAQAGKLRPGSGRMPGRPGMRPQRDGPRARPMPPRELMALVQEVNAEMQQAQREGKDLRKAAGLMQQAERAGSVGHFAKAMEFTREALKAIRSAPRLPPQPELFSNPLVAMFLDLMHVEDTDLAGTLAALRKTLDEAGEAAVTGLRKAIEEAADTLTRVGARRQAFSKRLQEIRGGQAPSPEEQKQATAQMRKKVDEARSELAGILAQSRELDPEQFAQRKEKIVDSILEALFGPAGPPAPGAGGTRLVRLPTTEERVRSKLLSASDPYLEVLGDPLRKQLATTTGELFRKARAHLAAREYEQAEGLVDEGLRLLGIRVEPRPEETSEAFDPTASEPLDAAPPDGVSEQTGEARPAGGGPDPGAGPVTDPRPADAEQTHQAP